MLLAGRGTMKALAGFLVAAAMLVVLGGASPAQASSSLSPTQTLAASFSAPNADIATILADTNVQRANAGLVPLVLSEQLTRVAQEWSAAQAAANAMSHNPNYSSQISSGWTRAGENVARGYQPSTVVSAWMASSGHRANILGNFNTIGIGYVNGYFTQVFALYPSFSDNADGVTRIAGRDRYATSAAISVDQFAPGVATVYLASGESFPDALSAAAAAGAAGVPVLLSRSTALPAEIISELARLRPEKIVVLGGENTISDSVLHAAEAYATDGVTRIAGRDRYATSAAISVDQFAPGVATVY
ncbi:cell wall-binding repeat-containing protein, partial [Microbacterium sp. NPDC076911]|uniref:cell wall-binding repeat-containing protein n=1 Tax=Microbacterium sp. NPDC076911 TaxID=3154958 RepID=UPI00342A0286